MVVLLSLSLSLSFTPRADEKKNRVGCFDLSLSRIAHIHRIWL